MTIISITFLIIICRHFDTNDKKEELYAELKAAAESGWDFSSRWFILNDTNKGMELFTYQLKMAD